GRPVATGVPGEVLIGGTGLARGYLGRPAETALRFVPDGLSGRSGERLYASGDLARFRPEGELEFLGRLDDQVKVRGFRVEPGEVEAALEAHEAVGRAVVALRGERLVAWLVPAGGERAKVEELRRFLAARLPEPMLPAAFVWLGELPLTSHGKVDRRALPDPGSDRPELEGAYVEPSTPLEEVLAAVWSEVLGVERIGARDNFFSLGGDSIRSVQVVALARERGLDLTVQDLFRHRTVEALGRQLEERLGLAEGEAAPSDEELAALLEEVEGLSDDMVLSRLRDQSEPERSRA
ncbi:MAG TPA: phosphopantetheine-binding protein, partial [Thermoanaerobaculia bacterium]|nr:phosphopantetheine-binding protein [Thermoanaerobaculia bacterium]